MLKDIDRKENPLFLVFSVCSQLVDLLQFVEYEVHVGDQTEHHLGGPGSV